MALLCLSWLDVKHGAISRFFFLVQIVILGSRQVITIKVTPDDDDIFSGEESGKSTATLGYFDAYGTAHNLGDRRTTPPIAA
jgi:hypothetical protein